MATLIHNTTSNQLLGSLVKELKNPLTLIARQAELEALNTENSSFYAIQDVAEQTLKLIDGYMLMSQSEYGQTSLPLQTIGVGSVVYDVVEELRPYAKNNKFIISSDVNDEIVMTHPQGLKTVLWCLVKLAVDFHPEVSKPKVLIRVGRTKDKSVSVSVLGDFEITKQDIDLARELQGRSHRAASMSSNGSGIQLAIADILALSIGSVLKPARSSDMKGLSFKLNKSQQLQLI